MSNFNPNAPETLGVELRPTVESSVVLTTPVRAAAMQFTATVTENITQASVYLSTVNLFSTWELEIYNVASLGDLETTVTACMPAQDVRNKNAWAQFDDGSGNNSVNIWQAIDSYPDALYRGKGAFFNSGVPIDNNELIYPQYGRSLDYACRFDGVNGASGSKRIVSIKLMAYAQQYIDLAFVAGMRITPYLLIDGVPYYGTPVDAPETAGGKLIEGYWPVNPATGCSWIAEDLDQFDHVFGGDSGAGWLIDATGSSNNLSTILQGWLEVETTNDLIDQRYAKGCLRPEAPGWWTFDLVSPISGDPFFAKTDDFVMAATLRQRREDGKIGWRYLAGDVDASNFQGRETTFTVEKQLLRSIDDENQRIFALLLINEDNEVSVDSQPYASIDGDRQLDLGIDDDWPAVSAGYTIEQEITTVGADAYGWVRAMVKLDPGPVSEPLTIKLVNGADVQQGTTLTIQPGEVERPGTSYHTVEGSIGAPSLLAATQYRLIFESDAANGLGWRVQTLSAFLEGGTSRVPPGVGAATWGGDVDAAVFNTVRHDEIDLVCTIATQPDPPEGLLADVDDGVVACDEFVTLSWEPTDLTFWFMRYEIDYSYDAGVTWERIGEITNESVSELEHREAKRNVLGSYRIRVRRLDWSCSEWSDIETATPVMDCCGYVLTSNAAPELTLWADDLGPERTTRPEQRVELQRYYGRNHAGGHHSLEWDGVSFTRTLVLGSEGVVAGNETPDAEAASEDEIYGALTAFLPSKGASLPYVCVLDQNGNRWFCSMDLGLWQHGTPGNVYTADVTFTTVTDVPSPIDIT
jgi:hypothetical protein